MVAVVDASLVVKWLVPEVDSDRALAFLERSYGQLHAPDLMLVEVGRAFVRLVNEDKLAEEEALGRVARLAGFAETAFHTHVVSAALAVTAVQMAMTLGHPLQDCIYLALADQLGCCLVTCDVKFHGRVGDPVRVKLLAELI